MGETTGIAWTNHTFNAWWGCTKVSAECDHCYAETFDKRVGGKNWGKDAPRRFFGEKHWREPLKWAANAAKAGERRRVFCSSMADVFEDRDDLETERQKLWALVRRTASLGTDRVAIGAMLEATDPARAAALRIESINVGTWGLDWLLLTKRPKNILKMCPPDVLPLVWAGATVGVKKSVWRAAELVKVPARVRFLSVEPQLEGLDLSAWLGACRCDVEASEGAGMHAASCSATRSRIDWVIQGGESGPKARPFDLEWARDLRDQCKAAGVAYFLKQLGADARGTRSGPPFRPGMPPSEFEVRLRLKDRAGADPSEWPADLRVQQFPQGQR